MVIVQFMERACPAVVAANGKLVAPFKEYPELKQPYLKLSRVADPGYAGRIMRMACSWQELCYQRLPGVVSTGVDSLIAEGSYPNSMLVVAGHVEQAAPLMGLECFSVLTLKLRLGYGLPGIVNHLRNAYVSELSPPGVL